MRAWFGRVEIPAADPRRTAAFYAEVFGWETAEVAAADGPYVSLRPAGGGTPAAPRSRAPQAAGGGVALPQVIGSSAPLAVVHVEGASLEEVLRRVEAAGGAVDLAPAAVGTDGRFARFTDPAGNLLGLWSDAGGG